MKNADTLFTPSCYNTNSLIEGLTRSCDPSDQDLFLIGEIAELTSALLNRRRGREDKANVTEELAHVLISCEVVRRTLGISLDKIEEESLKKLQKYGWLN